MAPGPFLMSANADLARLKGFSDAPITCSGSPSPRYKKRLVTGQGKG